LLLLFLMLGVGVEEFDVLEDLCRMSSGVFLASAVLMASVTALASFGASSEDSFSSLVE